MRLTLPYPPSINHYWRVVNGRPIKSREGREYMLKTQAIARAQLGAVAPFAGDVIVTVDVFRPRRIGDLDNTLKVLLDALRGVAYVDDSQVVSIEAQRYDDAADPRAEVTVLVITPSALWPPGFVAGASSTPKPPRSRVGAKNVRHKQTSAVVTHRVKGET